MDEPLEKPRRSRPRSFARLMLVLAIGLGAFFVAWRFLDPNAAGDLLMRDKPGARPVYVERPLAQHLLAVSRRADELLLKDGEGLRVENHALMKVGNEDWIAACRLLKRAAGDLRGIAYDGQAGARPAPALERLQALQSETERVRQRFAGAEMLQRGRLPEEMNAFLEDFAKLLAELQAAVH